MKSVAQESCLQSEEDFAGKLEEMPSFEAIKRGCQEGLRQFHQMADQTLSPSAYKTCLSIVIGILYLNVFGGRPMEWLTCKISDLQDVLSGKARTWACRSFKTAKYFKEKKVSFDDTTVYLLKVYIEKVRALRTTPKAVKME